MVKENDNSSLRTFVVQNTDVNDFTKKFHESSKHTVHYAPEFFKNLKICTLHQSSSDRLLGFSV